MAADNIWKERCLQQQEENRRLKEELERHQRDMNKLKMKGNDDGKNKIMEMEKTTIISVGGKKLEPSRSRLDGMSDLALRQLLKTLEKEKTEMEWKLKEYGWRLDQASAVSGVARLYILPIIVSIGSVQGKGGESVNHYSNWTCKLVNTVVAYMVVYTCTV